MPSGRDGQLPKVAAVITGAAARQDVRSLLRGQTSLLWVLSGIGELRGSPFVDEIDLLLVDLSSDIQTKLRFIETFRGDSLAKVIALIPETRSDLRALAINHGADLCADLTGDLASLKAAMAAVTDAAERQRFEPVRRQAAIDALIERLARLSSKDPSP